MMATEVFALEAEKNWSEVERALHEPPFALPAEAAKFVTAQLRELAEEMPNAECLGAGELSSNGVRRLQQELIRCYVKLWEAGAQSAAPPATVH